MYGAVKNATGKRKKTKVKNKAFRLLCILQDKIDDSEIEMKKRKQRKQTDETKQNKASSARPPMHA